MAIDDARRNELISLVSRAMADAVGGRLKDPDAEVLAAIELVLEELPADDDMHAKLLHLWECRKCRIKIAQETALKAMLSMVFGGATVEVVDMAPEAHTPIRARPPKQNELN